MSPEVSSSRSTASALKTLDIEMKALERLRDAMRAPQLGRAIEAAIHAIVEVRGRVIVTGIGKSGQIASKIAATMRSTGTSALYLHPSEASHGDLGIITDDDIVLAITWSGETAELGDILHYCRQRGVKLIVATSHVDSTAGRAADICLVMPQVREACPNELAPTSSTTLQLVLGDALAVALIEARGFTPSDFRAFHPGGRLGAQLCEVGQIMGTGEAVPRVDRDASLKSATIEMSLKRYGCTAVVDEADVLVGAFTDGDLRRCIAVHDLNDKIGLHMSPRPVTVSASTLASEALRLLNENAVSVLFVVEDSGRLAGIVHMHDIIRAGVVA
ncbi:arabinose-5-phosphate isomerase [Novosphingobium chloroacetimidivorans]|uniref:Arabinose-5-phosphate isomerase n=1 Tax=Novosphingobium chloroacetimidivorans TaxID=1428314 RepID=A0A7W7KD26_9SPHN|nr:KpsF/GutQ family sugar-phosphate isomerase [Novosphingobium chloroacetimidivorans]MBB4860567.1 arabinose-5-phosphate isomerase [Novosphingobium chloroacetimidivorans]